MGVSGDSVEARTENNFLVGILGHENGGKVEVGIRFRALAMVLGGFGFGKVDCEGVVNVYYCESISVGGH